MRIVFMGSPHFALPSLNKLHQSDHEIVAVASNVDKRRGRGGKTSPTPVKKRAIDLGIPTIDVDKTDDPLFSQQLKALEPDLFVVVAFRILPKHLLEIPSKGSINLHASLLPKYRGAAPIHWAIIKGEEETGCTVFFLNEAVDAGKIIQQERLSIGPNETTGDVYDRMKEKGATLLVRSVDEITADNYSLSDQDEAGATPAPKLYRDDCKLDFNAPAQDVHNRIRGLSPFPTAFATLGGQKFNIYRSKMGPDRNLEPGALALVEDDLVVGCADGTVILETVQPESKRKMSGVDFYHGYNDDLPKLH